MAAATPEDEQRSANQITGNEKFFRYFQHEVTDLQEQISRIGSITTLGGERADAVDHCLSAITRLSNEVQDASSYIPAYDQRTYGDAIKALNTKLQEIREAAAPKPKFSFKSRSMFTAKKNESAISLNDAAELAKQRHGLIHLGPAGNRSSTTSSTTTPADSQTPANERADEAENSQNQDDHAAPTGADEQQQDPGSIEKFRRLSFSQSKFVSIKNHENVHIVLPISARHASSAGTLSNLARCVIDLSQQPTATATAPHEQQQQQQWSFAALTLTNITSSLVLCGHVHGAVHLTNIRNSVVVVASRQFRMHESAHCDVYLLVPSRPIIEDCTAIRFAPLPPHYHYHDSDSDDVTNKDQDQDRERGNKWSQVDDFKWLQSGHSPHWSILDPAARIADRTWKETVPGGPELGVEEILRAVDLPQ